MALKSFEKARLKRGIYLAKTDKVLLFDRLDLLDQERFQSEESIAEQPAHQGRCPRHYRHWCRGPRPIGQRFLPAGRVIFRGKPRVFLGCL